ncbi:hemagluttinin repeat-containing protein [Ignavibacterium album JCM 16511]|uniref:Hemagluttinin repeat-containing protein n=1 Tax=Ignavibacterium album (strain DSM 19864 / JCM 16511 / NBRC 101810 / Mat9-16) TaxID=945713 RepID=I0AM14_IGNAJ|nr:T9SS type A sorting domain-containing protein [Ignavibacterium album]AFH50021.1 hemagluttinin repeat-containing protein [Ignavibacterium album JCM 16511]
MKSFMLFCFLSFLFLAGFLHPQSPGSLSPQNIQVSFPFYDDVEDTATSSTYWTRDASIWKMLAANAHSGSNVWAMLPATGTYQHLTFASAINLSSTVNPYISLWSRKADGGTGYIQIEASTNGGTSWTVIKEGSFNGTQYVRFQGSLLNYRQANVLIRIGCYVPYGNTYYVDDIRIDEAPAPQPILLSNPTENGMNVHWNQSTALDFYRYRIVISTNQNTVNDFNATPVTQNREETRVFDIFVKTKLDTTLTDLTFTNTLYYAKVYEEDTQNFINQGSERTDLSTTFNATGEVAPFTQTFEGSFNWVADIPWAVTTDDAGDPGHSPTHAFEDSPSGNYPANADRRLVGMINLNSVQRPLLRFNHKYAFETGSDYGLVEVSPDNVTWVTLNGYTGNSGGEWRSDTYDIGFIKQTSNTAYLRYKVISNSVNQQDGWHLDDVQVLNNPKTIAFPLFDDVETDTFTINRWTAGAFELKLANAHSGAQVWSLKPSGGTYSYITLGGVMNLSGAANPYISFWARKADAGTGYVKVEASGDGGYTWTSVGENSFSGNYQRFQYPLSNFRTANFMVRIGFYTPYGNTYYLDDILIDNAPTPRSLVLLNPTNNGMKVRWGISTANDFDHYRVVISTNQNTVNDYYATEDLQNRTETKVFDIFNKATIETTLTNLTFMNTLYYAKIYEQDTQLLINQGSDRADLSTSFNVVSEVAPFIQTFENTFGWAADLPWAVTQDDSSEPGHSGTHALEDSPLGNYSSNSDRRITLQMNTLALSRPTLRFNHKYSFQSGSDYGILEYSSDGATWTKFAGFTGNSQSTWEQRVFDLVNLRTTNAVYLRFSVQSNLSNNQDGWHIDDVEIFNNERTQGIPLNDDVEVDSVSKFIWLNGQWDIKIANAHSGTQVWALEPAGGSQYAYLTVAGSMNLANAPKPYVSLWTKKANGGTGFIAIEASNNFGSTWTKVKEQSFSGNNYVNIVASLSGFSQNNVILRIGAYTPYGDTYFIDDITIADSTGFTTGIEDEGFTPLEFSLEQNYPNPFNPITNIRFALPNESKVTLKVFNILGQQVTELVNELKPAGYHNVEFNASGLSSGVYLYQINAIDLVNSKKFTLTKKLILLK